MDPNELRQLRSQWELNRYREDGDRRDEFEEPWYWSSTTISEDSGDYEAPWDDIRRRERMAEAMYEC